MSSVQYACNSTEAYAPWCFIVSINFHVGRRYLEKLRRRYLNLIGQSIAMHKLQQIVSRFTSNERQYMSELIRFAMVAMRILLLKKVILNVSFGSFCLVAL